MKIQMNWHCTNHAKNEKNTYIVWPCPSQYLLFIIFIGQFYIQIFDDSFDCVDTRLQRCFRFCVPSNLEVDDEGFLLSSFFKIFFSEHSASLRPLAAFRTRFDPQMQ